MVPASKSIGVVVCIHTEQYQSKAQLKSCQQKAEELYTNLFPSQSKTLF